MEFFELRAAMVSGRPVMAKVQEPTFQRVVTGTVAEVGYRLDRDGKESGYAAIKERGKNSVTSFKMEEVDPVWKE